jgi:hypothetical protein
MVAGRFRFHSGCGSRRIGSSTEPTTQRTAAWFASRLRLASSVSCVRPRVNSCRCGLIFVCLAAHHDFQGIIGQGRCSAFAASYGARGQTPRSPPCSERALPWDGSARRPRSVPLSESRRPDAALGSVSAPVAAEALRVRYHLKRTEDLSTSFGLSLRSTPP